MTKKSNQTIQPFQNQTALSKSKQNDFAQNLIDSVTNGDVDPIAAFCQIKGLYDSLALFLKSEDVREVVETAKEKWGNEPAVYSGAKLTISESGVKYDYSCCCDEIWNRLSREKAALDTMMKEREMFLRGIKKQVTIVDEETGAVDTIYAPLRSSSSCIKVTFAK